MDSAGDVGISDRVLADEPPRYAKLSDGELEQIADLWLRRAIKDPSIQSALIASAAALILIARGNFFDKPWQP